MLNALIALLGDSWGSVQENKIAYFYQERIAIILELKIFFSAEHLKQIQEE